MSRQTRLVLPGVALHIIQRGNNRQLCFRCDGDYMLYLLHLRELAAEYACAIHAYCLMPNHVHLLATPSGAETLAALMRGLGQRFVQYFNRAYGRTGTLWEGRFRSCVTESAHYVLACYRYIELNPVRAQMAEQPSAFKWSSYRANAEGHTDNLVSPHAEYDALGLTPETRRAAYSALFTQTLPTSLLEDIRSSTNGGYPLASKSFKSSIPAPPGRKLTPGRPGRPLEETKTGGDGPLEI
jgi:putative transposase